MRLMEITQDVFVICCQLLCATYVGNGISQNQLGEQVSFYGSDVAHQIANGVAGFVGQLIWSGGITLMMLCVVSRTFRSKTKTTVLFEFP
jgi:hypothetical protein